MTMTTTVVVTGSSGRTGSRVARAARAAGLRVRVREPFIDVGDLADVVVAALAAEDGRYVGRTLEVSGPRLLTFGEAVAEIAAQAGRELTYRAVPAREYGERLARFGVPPEEAGFLVELFGSLLDGRNAHLSDGVRQVLGREPRDFTEFAKEAAAAGAWTR